MRRPEIMIVLKKHVKLYINEENERIKKLGYTCFSSSIYPETLIPSNLIKYCCDSYIILPNHRFALLSIGRGRPNWLFTSTILHSDPETCSEFIPLSYIDMIIDNNTGEILFCKS